jgi:hypothetical protein
MVLTRQQLGFQSRGTLHRGPDQRTSAAVSERDHGGPQDDARRHGRRREQGRVIELDAVVLAADAPERSGGRSGGTRKGRRRHDDDFSQPRLSFFFFLQSLLLALGSIDQNAGLGKRNDNRHCEL